MAGAAGGAAGDDELREIEGFTWPGIEFGEPPSYKFSFFEYVDALRAGDIEQFQRIEKSSGDWWHVGLDRGAGAALHFAADHGQAGSVGLTVIDVAVKKGRGWEPGRVRTVLQGLIDKYRDVPKVPASTYEGPLIGPTALRVLEAWEAAPPRLPPDNWRPPPPAGFADAQGMRRAAEDPWRPAGDGDGSFRLRPMTQEELRRQSAAVAAAV